MLQYELDEPLFRLIGKVGEKVAVDTYWEGVRAIETLASVVSKVQSSCGFEPKKSMYLAHDAKALSWLKQEFDCRTKYGLPVSWLGKSMLNAIPVPGDGAIISSSGGSLDAYRLTHDLLDFSVANFGLKVFDHTQAKHIEFEEHRQQIETSTGHTIDSKKVVFASGYETQFLLDHKIVDLISTYAMISEPVTIPTWLQHTILWNTQDPYLYMRATPDSRILIGGKDEQFKDAQRRDSLIDRKEECLLACARSLLPDSDIVADFAWAGTFGVTKDSLPYIGAHEDYPGCFFVLGFGGNGKTFSVMGMNIISDAIAGRDNRFLHYYSFDR
jgi:glycine/D-amino acid oxidase-like deaminating enzyme